MELLPSTILAHAAQLVAAGWTAAAPAISERVAAQFFAAKDASGAPWEGVLMAVGSKTALTVSLAMHRERTHERTPIDAIRDDLWCWAVSGVDGRTIKGAGPASDYPDSRRAGHGVRTGVFRKAAILRRTNTN